jgi:hypothetical protein
MTADPEILQRAADVIRPAEGHVITAGALVLADGARAGLHALAVLVP